ncbi:NAD(P)/FAD-dependent oxidoreductase [Methylorubrum populi]|jgi:thioredoxin reductase|uniref:NAD(P)/FAD-dependent oxidoreductase n=1 Tax=Methylorubrum rhodesianum TaxID=29427 RepID=UPI000348F950|nr:NAD(P)/FAD-dependent oxidoreductase [Methylorubrum rhodesianum]MBK3405749.1 NAD(P)/FAD-dependent oxidoreductase [Methylorubrum rhodesianum]MBY0139064.1 NAD(P)/FAD-dependent oxidoreductase [Methylorubrum populi]
MRSDAIIVGGSFAGLSAALYIARARRRVCVIDAGAPRNRFAAASHGFFAQDGENPLAMIAAARAQLAGYPNASFVAGEAVSARAAGDGFAVSLADGQRLEASKLVLAFGISDILPDLPGLAERWGTSVLHCPYCHGFEFAGRVLGVLFAGPKSIHQAELIAEWGPTTLFLNGHPGPDAQTSARLAGRDIRIEPGPVRALAGDGRALSALVMADGRAVPLDALFVGPRYRLNSPIAEELGCALDEGMLGPTIRTDAMKETTVPGVYAAGDAARFPHSVAWASADGVTAGVSLHQALVFPRMAA